MTKGGQEFLTLVRERGYLHQCTDIDGLASEKRIVAYIGYDCTAPSLHVGNLVSVMLLRWLQRCGHKPIVLVGGGTSKVGDPSGKDESRRLLADEDIAKNMAGIKNSFNRFLEFGEGANDAVMVDNSEWLDALQYIPFLQKIGRHFSVNRMLGFESVKTRLEREQPLSFIEFNYMVLQAYDFLELNRRYGCQLQMGGSDQWGNIVTGVELGRRVDDTALYGLTTPLITTSSGAKMGKSARGAVWLNPDMLPAFEYWQFWRNTEDGDVARFLRLFTDLPMDEINRLEKLQGEEINQAKIILATEATAFCHGRQSAEAAAKSARELFASSDKNSSGDLVSESVNSIPRYKIAGEDLARGVSVLDLFVLAKFSSSKAEARRLIRGGGARVNGEVVENEMQIVNRESLDEDGCIRISAGKKRHAQIHV